MYWHIGVSNYSELLWQLVFHVYLKKLYFQEIQNLVERYIIIYGYPDNTFRGNQFITRAEMVYLLASGLNTIFNLQNKLVNSSQLCCYKQPPLHSFSLPKDIKINDWYHQSYATLVWFTGNKFTYPDDTFRADRAATRAETVVFIKNVLDAFLESIKYSTSSDEYSSLTESLNNLSDEEYKDLFKPTRSVDRIVG